MFLLLVFIIARMLHVLPFAFDTTAKILCAFHTFPLLLLIFNSVYIGSFYSIEWQYCVVLLYSSLSLLFVWIHLIFRRFGGMIFACQIDLYVLNSKRLLGWIEMNWNCINRTFFSDAHTSHFCTDIRTYTHFYLNGIPSNWIDSQKWLISQHIQTMFEFVLRLALCMKRLWKDRNLKYHEPKQEKWGKRRCRWDVFMAYRECVASMQ